VTNFTCPLPISDYKAVILAHGSGGGLTHDLINKLFFPRFQNPMLAAGHDGSVFQIGGAQLAFTTDSFVVTPIFFPGGDIGVLAVNGTVNDLAMCGAKPLYLSCGFILEEGLPMGALWRIVLSMEEAAKGAGVQLITGDTKVVERGKADKLFINTSGIGIVETDQVIAPAQVREGDCILISGPIGDHGIAIMSVREGLTFETEIQSDTAALNSLVSAMLDTGAEIHCLRDPTRGGLASALNEIARTAKLGVLIEEKKILIREAVYGACEILGLDPLYVANEGVLIAFVAPTDAGAVLEAMQGHPLGKSAAMIGRVVADHPGTVLLKSQIGGTRVVDMLPGEQLPRIC
jgi:hydrogenase expression/formation protein HypE